MIKNNSTMNVISGLNNNKNNNNNNNNNMNNKNNSKPLIKSEFNENDPDFNQFIDKFLQVVLDDKQIKEFNISFNEKEKISEFNDLVKDFNRQTDDHFHKTMRLKKLPKGEHYNDLVAILVLVCMQYFLPKRILVLCESSVVCKQFVKQFENTMDEECMLCKNGILNPKKMLLFHSFFTYEYANNRNKLALSLLKNLLSISNFSVLKNGKGKDSKIDLNLQDVDMENEKSKQDENTLKELNIITKNVDFLIVYGSEKISLDEEELLKKVYPRSLFLERPKK